jgi:uncharacterized protein (DUF2147 family)
MRYFVAAAAALLLSTGQVAAQDPIEGLWKTEPDAGMFAHIQVQPCGDKICGVIAQSFDNGEPFKSANMGKNLVFDMVNKGDGKYEGKVWRPSNDKVYLGKMVLKGDTLDMKGCVAGGMLCSKQKWTRLK